LTDPASCLRLSETSKVFLERNADLSTHAMHYEKRSNYIMKTSLAQIKKHEKEIKRDKNCGVCNRFISRQESMEHQPQERPVGSQSLDQIQKEWVDLFGEQEGDVLKLHRLNSRLHGKSHPPMPGQRSDFFDPSIPATTTTSTTEEQLAAENLRLSSQLQQAKQALATLRREHYKLRDLIKPIPRRVSTSHSRNRQPGAHLAQPPDSSHAMRPADTSAVNGVSKKGEVQRLRAQLVAQSMELSRLQRGVLTTPGDDRAGEGDAREAAFNIQREDVLPPTAPRDIEGWRQNLRASTSYSPRKSATVRSSNSPRKFAEGTGRAVDNDAAAVGLMPAIDRPAFMAFDSAPLGLPALEPSQQRFSTGDDHLNHPRMPAGTPKRRPSTYYTINPYEATPPRAFEGLFAASAETPDSALEPLAPQGSTAQKRRDPYLQPTRRISQTARKAQTARG
jgi:hypothetical protein